MKKIIAFLFFLGGVYAKHSERCYGSLPAARSCSEDICFPLQWGGAIGLSYVGWWAQEDGLAFALKNKTSSFQNVQGKIVGVDFSYASGFKLDLDLQFPSRAWDLDLRWTTFYDRSAATHYAQVSPSGAGLLPLWILPQIYPSFNNFIVYGIAHGVWKVHLNTVDLELGYDPFLTRKLSLRLHGGIKGISLFQHLTIDYSEGALDGIIPVPPSRAGLRNECLGIGPRIGFDSKWRLINGWFLLANSSGSLTIDFFSLKRKDEDRRDILILSTFREHFFAFHPNFEALFGVGWNYCFGKQKEFGIQCSYEVQYFWEQNMIRQLVTEEVSFLGFSSRGDFSVKGINATIFLNF